MPPEAASFAAGAAWVGAAAVPSPAGGWCFSSACAAANVKAENNATPTIEFRIFASCSDGAYRMLRRRWQMGRRRNGWAQVCRLDGEPPLLMSLVARRLA
jgi:hypothetical protein